MKLSASIYSKNQLDIQAIVTEIDSYGLDYIHVDCNENCNVFDDIKKINAISNTAIDVHLISESPNIYYERIEELNIDRVSFQIESLDTNFTFPHFSTTKIGLAILISNPNLMSIISQYYNQLDFVLLMTTTPGISGGIFDHNSFQIIRSVIQKYPTIPYCIDGGVNHEIAFILRLLGVESIVIGNYLMNNQNMASSLLQLKNKSVHSNFLVKNYMIEKEDLPLVTKNTPVLQMLQILEEYKLGMVFCIDEESKLIGIISNADIRKILLDESFSYQNSISNFINYHPKTIDSESNTSDMLKFIGAINFPILVLPIIDKNKHLCGAISFLSLTKGD